MTEVQTLSLSLAARRLELHPFELIRLGIRHDCLPARLSYTAALLEQTAQEAGIESVHRGVQLNSASEAIQSALRTLLDGGYVDGRLLRADNLWRGLDEPLRGAVLGAVDQLVALGLLLRAQEAGVDWVCMPAEAETRIRRVAQGEVGIDAV